MSLDDRTQQIMQKLMQDSFHDMPGRAYQLVPGMTAITGEIGVLRALHEHAMDHAENAHRMKRHGIHDEASWWMALSFEAFVAIRVDYQPGKSILARSVASLALCVGTVEILKTYAARGLEEGCPGDIAEEIRAVLAEARAKWPAEFEESV